MCPEAHTLCVQALCVATRGLRACHLVPMWSCAHYKREKLQKCATKLICDALLPSLGGRKELPVIILGSRDHTQVTRQQRLMHHPQTAISEAISRMLNFGIAANQTHS